MCGAPIVDLQITAYGLVVVFVGGVTDVGIVMATLLTLLLLTGLAIVDLRIQRNRLPVQPRVTL